jgi:hypothetical protein
MGGGAAALGIKVTIGERDWYVRDTFAMALRLEERFGPLAKFVTRDRSGIGVLELADFLAISLTDAPEPPPSRAEIQSHIAEVGVIAALDDMSRITGGILLGWRRLQEVAGNGNPPMPAAADTSPGMTSTPPRLSSDGLLPSSGEPAPSSLPPQSLSAVETIAAALARAKARPQPLPTS